MATQTRGIHLEKAVGQTYTIYIPHRYTQGERVPLVLLLHWAGKKHRFFGRDILEQLGLPALNELEAIIVAPDRKRRHWATPKAEQDIVRLLAYLDANYRIQPQKKVLAGYSMGGMGVWYLASQRPEMFACGVAMASPIPEELLSEGWDFPLYALHSKLDEIFSYESVKNRVGQFQEMNAPVHLGTVEFASHLSARDFIEPFHGLVPWIRDHLSR